MIISTLDQEDHWNCLIRRGMLHSETEAIEHWALAPGQTLNLGEQGVHEAFIVLSGEAEIQGQRLASGSLLLAPAHEPGFLTAISGTTLLSIRTYPDTVTRMLPPRVPELPESDRAI